MKKFQMLFVALGILFIHNAVNACVCAAREDVSESAIGASTIFVGTVIDSKIEKREIDFLGDRSQIVQGDVRISRVRVDEAFRDSKVGEIVEVETDNYSTCSFSLLNNIQYLVYANTNKVGKLETDYCSYSREIELAFEDVTYLRKNKKEPKLGGVEALKFRNVEVETRRFASEPTQTSKDWIRDSVIYQIFPRQYSQKGDFNSITADLDRLKTLGVDVLWLMPVHPIGQEMKKGTVGSPYAVNDYYGVNPDYGTPDDLKRLVAEAHKRGMKVIIDVVLNHTAWDNTLIKQHPEFYKKNDKGEIVPPVADWADVAGLDYGSKELRKYIIENLKSWIRDYDLDGFRCDVAMMIPTDFWEEARAEVDKVKANTIWVAEAEKPELLHKAFDVDYSWEMHHAMNDALQGTKPASVIRKIWEEQAKSHPAGAVRMRFSDNHDERRAVARFGEKGALACQALMFTLDGVPLVYNGTEVGDTTESGAPALFEKMPIFWKIAERRPEFPKFYSSMIALRKSSKALRRGSLEWVSNSDESRIVTFFRKSGEEEVLVAINLSNSPFSGTVKADGTFKDITPNDTATTDNVPVIKLNSFQFRIFKKTL